jgi:hypothetical protein
MSQLIGPSPLQELDLRDYLRTQPNTFLHFVGSEPLTPSTGGQLREVGEGAKGHLGVFSNSLEDLASRRRHQACPHPGCVNEVLPTVETHHQGINAQMAGNVAAHNEFRNDHFKASLTRLRLLIKVAKSWLG